MTYHCFTIMGYGEKTDYKLSKKINLDKIYGKLIKPTLSNFDNIDNLRGDEISNSEIIDTDMFELLLSADIVIADITTLNPNAIYELGIRHALKPYSTIILSLDQDDLPFDFNHNRIFRYSLKDINDRTKLQAKVRELRSLLETIVKNLDDGQEICDSPFYEYVKYVKRPNIPADKLEQIRSRHYDSETIKSLMDQAHRLTKERKYQEAASTYKKLSLNNRNNPYYIQQQALLLSKVTDTDHKRNLIEAEKIIKKLNPFNSLDCETTGIYGGIEKRLFSITKYKTHLDNAIRSYNRGFILDHNYYNGENVVNCLIYKLLDSTDNEELIYLKYSINNLNKDVLNLALQEKDKQIRENSDCDYWLFATISLSYLLMGDNPNYIEFKSEFECQSIYDREKQAFKETEDLRKEALKRLMSITIEKS